MKRFFSYISGIVLLSVLIVGLFGITDIFGATATFKYKDTIKKETVTYKGTAPNTVINLQSSVSPLHIRAIS